MKKSIPVLCGLQTLLEQIKNYLDVKTNKIRHSKRKELRILTGKMNTERDLEKAQLKLHTTEKKKIEGFN